MFIYTKATKPISIRMPGCVYQSHKIETKDKIYFIFDLLDDYEGSLIIETYDRVSKRFERIESTSELMLISDDSSPIDYYELSPE